MRAEICEWVEKVIPHGCTDAVRDGKEEADDGHTFEKRGSEAKC
jgi:hypothetical protein